MEIRSPLIVRLIPVLCFKNVGLSNQVVLVVSMHQDVERVYVTQVTQDGVANTVCVYLLSQNISKPFPFKSSEDDHSTILACAQGNQNGQQYML